jgi:hypothetical protein
MRRERMFPIQDETTTDRIERPRGQVPWFIAEMAYLHYVELYGRCQTLERIADRGGFGWSELVSLLLKQRPSGTYAASGESKQ